MPACGIIGLRFLKRINPYQNQKARRRLAGEEHVGYTCMLWYDTHAIPDAN